MKSKTRLQVSRSHRLLGILAIFPIVGWILSSFVLHGVGLLLPNGLAGDYELNSFHRYAVNLEAPELASPTQALQRAQEDGLQRVYWLRLEPLGNQLAYIVKPGPFELERVYDATTLRRLDPLDEETLRAIANDQLSETEVEGVGEGEEFNRYYTMAEVPAIEFTMHQAQPSKLIISRASGRTLRRTDPGADLFAKAYRSLHVWQWGNSMVFFSTLLYGGAALALVLVVLGYFLWWTRRGNRKRWRKSVRPARRFHARLAPFVGILLATQMLVGAYLWFNLGLIEPRFRGQGSFQVEWTGGISVTEILAEPGEILAALSSAGPAQDRSHPIQRYEWRAVGEQRFWIAYPRRNSEGILLNASSGEVWERIPQSLAAEAGAAVVLGEAADRGVESSGYWMDYNLRVPTYRFRFTDPDNSDVHVSQTTGEIIQRRPAIWRAFGPFLSYHTFGFSGNKWFDTLLLVTLQLSILTMVVSGCLLAFTRGRKQK